jgi:transposase
MAHISFSQPNPLRFQGIDVSKATFDVAWWGDLPFQQMLNRSFPRTPEGVKAWLTCFKPGELLGTAVVMETTAGYCKELAGWILAACPGFHVAIANPYRVKAYAGSLGLRNKTDRVDARMLAMFGQERQPGPWAPLSAAQEELRALTRTRSKLKATRTAYINRMKSKTGGFSLDKKCQKEVLACLDRQIKALEQGIRNLCRKNPDIGLDLNLLMSIKGVGLITAASILGAAGDLRRFKRRNELTAFLGVSPRQVQSGTSVQCKAHMCRTGDKHVRTVLYMAAVAACRTKGPLGDYYRRLVASGKPKKSALGALMRKLLIVMRAVLIQGTPYQVIPAHNAN